MRMTIGKRVLMFFHWLLSLLICAAFALYLIVPDFIMKYYTMVEQAVGQQYMNIIGIALLAIYAILALIQIYLIFKHRKRSERGFITVDSSDTGKVRIAVSAIEQMVRQSVNNIDGITEMKIGIDSQDDAIVISVRASIINGSHVPTITMNMQRAIRQFVEMNCGVAVRAVSISIDSVTNQADASHRRRFGRGKGETAQPVPAYAAPVTPPQEDTPSYAVPEATPVQPETVANEAPKPVTYEAPAPVATPQPEPVAPAQFEIQRSEYDPDKPYESEFAKDLAAMKAREAAEAAEGPDDAEAPQDRDESY